KLWDVSGPQEVQEIATLDEHLGYVYSVSFSPDGELLASGDRFGIVKLWNVASHQEVATLTGHSDRILSVSFSPDGKLLASGSWDSTVKLWDISSGQEVATLTEHSGPVYSVSFSPDGKLLASASWDSTVKLWDISSGQEVATLIYPVSTHSGSRAYSFRGSDSVHSVSFSPDGELLAIGSAAGTVLLWDITPYIGPPYHIITATAEVNGGISPEGDVGVTHGSSQKFTITSYECHNVADVLVDEKSMGAITEYTFQNVASNHTIHAIFDIDTYTITSTSGESGNISPSGNVTVECGEEQKFTITPNDCYHVEDVLVDGKSVLDQLTDNTYTITDVQTDHTIEAIFDIDAYTISASARGNGTISPSGEVIVDCKESQMFTIAPKDCYHIADVLVDGESVLDQLVGNTYTITDIQTDHTIEAIFGIDKYTIAATSGESGSISPSGDVLVNCGSDQTFVIEPNDCYHIEDVFVDGVSVLDQLTDNTYTIANVQTDHTIEVIFEIDSYTISATSGENGKISPSGDVTVDCNENQTFIIIPDRYYQVAEVVVDDKPVDVDTLYTFEDVTSNQTIAASFSPIPLSILAVRDNTMGMTQKTGDVFTVTVIQESSAASAERGSYDIGENITEQMLYNDETHGDIMSGDNIWTGQYTVMSGDDVHDAPVVAYLYTGDSVVQQLSDTTISIDTIPPKVLSIDCPEKVAEGNVDIAININEEGSGIDDRNTTISVQFDIFTRRGERITVPVEGQYRIPNSPDSTAIVWQGTGTIMKEYGDSIAYIVIHGGQDKAGNTLLLTGTLISFEIDVDEDIEEVGHDGKDWLREGDSLTVWMDGTSGKQASFDIPGLVAGVSMAETETGRYEGAYTVQAGDYTVAAEVRCHLDNAEKLAEKPVSMDAVEPEVYSVSVEPVMVKVGDVRITVRFTENMDATTEPSVT
ncbi:WD40 repeat domain-containing protein, partial [Candidatus Poribacteria bacterium]